MAHWTSGHNSEAPETGDLRNPVEEASIAAMAPPAPTDPPEDPAAIFRGRPWRKLPRDAHGKAASVPTMLSPKEQRFYFWLAHHWATGAGAIVDLGCFAGGSAARLAEGVQRAGRATEIHAYDRFRASEHAKKNFLYSAGIEPFEGEDLAPLSERLLEPWSPLIHLHRGEIEDTTWTGGPIELLTIDAAKSAAATDKIAEIFFPALIPNRSIVLHQDFLHWKVPWLPAQMEWFADCFEPVAFCPRDTLAFLCKVVPDADAFARGSVRGRRDREITEAIGSARKRLSHWPIDQRFVEQIKAVGLNPNARRAKDFAKRP